MRRCEEISRGGSPHSTARGWQSSGARGDETKARTMHPSTCYTCNLYPREVSSSSERSFIPIGPRTPPEPERFHSRGANLAQPSDATPLPRHLWSLKRPVFSTGGRIQFARAIFSSLTGEGEPRYVTAAGLLARRSALLKWSRNAPIASDARPTATRRTR